MDEGLAAGKFAKKAVAELRASSTVEWRRTTASGQSTPRRSRWSARGSFKISSSPRTTSSSTTTRSCGSGPPGSSRSSRPPESSRRARPRASRRTQWRTTRSTTPAARSPRPEIGSGPSARRSRSRTARLPSSRDSPGATLSALSEGKGRPRAASRPSTRPAYPEFASSTQALADWTGRAGLHNSSSRKRSGSR